MINFKDILKIGENYYSTRTIGFKNKMELLAKYVPGKKDYLRALRNTSFGVYSICYESLPTTLSFIKKENVKTVKTSGKIPLFNPRKCDHFPAKGRLKSVVCKNNELCPEFYSDVSNFFDQLVDITGVSYKNLGITNSGLVGFCHKKYSDIDVVCYGKRSSKALLEAWPQLTAAKGFTSYEKERAFLSERRRYPSPHSPIMTAELRKAQCLYDGYTRRHVQVEFVRTKASAFTNPLLANKQRLFKLEILSAEMDECLKPSFFPVIDQETGQDYILKSNEIGEMLKAGDIIELNAFPTESFFCGKPIIYHFDWSQTIKFRQVIQ